MKKIFLVRGAFHFVKPILDIEDQDSILSLFSRSRVTWSRHFDVYARYAYRCDNFLFLYIVQYIRGIVLRLRSRSAIMSSVLAPLSRTPRGAIASLAPSTSRNRAVRSSSPPPLPRTIRDSRPMRSRATDADNARRSRKRVLKPETVTIVYGRASSEDSIEARALNRPAAARFKLACVVVACHMYR